MIKMAIVMFKLFMLTFVVNMTHMLSNLILVEFMAVAATAMSISSLTQLALEIYMTLFMLIMLITESILGLSILISIIRTHSNDYMKSSSSTSC